jgi:RNA polymerase sigma-70 factor (ECF subfamily)
VSEAILARARAGDEQAFRELTEPHWRELQLHCYRLLGSLTDAEDLLQETLLAAWRGLDTFEQRASVRTWLYRIATNRCLNALRDAGRRVPAAPVPPFEPPEPTRWGDVTWLQPYPDTPETRFEQRETIELAFIAGLQRLPPRQTATLVLHDVLGFPTQEIASMLDTSETAVKGMLQRARGNLKREPTREYDDDVAQRFAEAFTNDDIDGVVALLTDDAWLAMPPAPHEYQGRRAIATFLEASAKWRAGRPLRLVPTRANAQPAFACFIEEERAGLIVLTVDGDHIRAITRFLPPAY